MTERTRWDDRIAGEDDLCDEASRQWDDDERLARLAREAAELSAVANRAITDGVEPDALLEELADARLLIELVARSTSQDRLEEAVDERIDHLEQLLGAGQPCPACETGTLEVSGAIYARCDDCEAVFGRDEVDL